MTEQPRPPLPVRAWRYYQRHGIGRLLRRMRDEFRPVVPSRPERSSLPSSGLTELEPALIYSHLDAPLEGAIESSSFLMVSGWACSRAGIAKVEAYIDGELAGAMRHGESRPDVADYLPRIPGAGASGFSGELTVRDLHHGSHRLELVIDDLAGSRRILEAVVRRVEDEALYEAWYQADLPDAAEIEDLTRQLGSSGNVPEIVVWLDARDPDGLAESIRSLDEPSYDGWRCVVLAASEEHPAIEVLLDKHARTNRERFVVRPPDAVSQPDGAPESYCGFLAAGETLAPGALLRFAGRAMTGFPDLLYSDRDSLRADGRRVDPWFNPDWSPDYLLGRDYVGGFFLLRDGQRTALIDSIDQMAGPAWRYDLLLRLTDDMAAAKIAHIPHVLYSARHDPDGVAAGTDAELDAGVAALARRGVAAHIEPGALPGTRRAKWNLGDSPKVSIIVPTTGRMEFLEPLVTSLTAKTEYANYELIFIDNSRGKNPDGIGYLRAQGIIVLERDEEFNWAKLNNDGARAATGELLLFLNDDVEIVEAEWLTELVGQALRPDVGAVGALLLYPDGRIQHGGVFVVGYGGGAVHYFQGMDPANAIYRDLHRAQREVSAVTGACLMIQRSKFEALGGFNEHLEIAGNDVDLCLRLLREGYRNIWTPYCVLVHHESASRLDTNIVGDETKIWQLWGDLLRTGDPYHSPNFAKDRVDLAIDARKVHIPQGTSKHPPGVNLIGYIRAEMGMGEAARSMAATLDEAGIMFGIIDYQTGNPARMSDDSWAHKVMPDPMYDVNVVYINADLTPEAYPRMPAGTFDDRYTIGCWSWELPDFPDAWLDSFGLVDEVWVPSAFVQDAISLKSPVPVIRMPHAIRAPTAAHIPRSELGLPTDGYQFLTMFDSYSIRERKNPVGAIRAFQNAFSAGDEQVSLVVKVNNSTIQELNAIREEIGGGWSNIHIIDRVLDRHQAQSLIGVSDCFVSLHRAEGFGLPIAEAMSMGRPVIATNWSGNVDFMDPATSACVDYKLVRLGRDYGPYRADQVWAQPDLDQASAWMTRLSSNPDLGLTMGERAAERIAQRLAPEVIAARVARRLEQIRYRRFGRAPSLPESAR